MAQIVGGALAYGVSRGFEEGHYSFESWKAIFLVTGLATAVYGIFMFFFLADSPVSGIISSIRVVSVSLQC